MFKVRYLVIAVAAASAVGLAVPVVGFAGPPQTQPPEQGAWCGLVPGTFVDTITSDVQRQADGNSIDHATLRSVFTANETGKSIISSASSTTKSTGPIDLGNGTFGFVTKTTGLALKFQVPNGSSAEGRKRRTAAQRGDAVIRRCLQLPDPKRRYLHHNHQLRVPRPPPWTPRRGLLWAHGRLPARSVEDSAQQTDIMPVDGDASARRLPVRPTPVSRRLAAGWATLSGCATVLPPPAHPTHARRSVGLITDAWRRPKWKRSPRLASGVPPQYRRRASPRPQGSASARGGVPSPSDVCRTSPSTSSYRAQRPTSCVRAPERLEVNTAVEPEMSTTARRRRQPRGRLAVLPHSASSQSSHGRTGRRHGPD